MTKKTRWVSASLGVIGLAVGLSGCVSSGFEPIAVTKDQSVVSSCQSLGEVSVPASKTYDDSVKALLQVAKTKSGANYLLIASAEPTDPPTDDELRGVAYRCSMPATASAPPASGSGH